MCAPILAPIVAMALSPRALGPRLVLAVVGVALPLGPLPTSPSRSLTGRSTAVLLSRDLRTRSERPAAGRTPPPLHGHSLRPRKPERSASNGTPTNAMEWNHSSALTVLTAPASRGRRTHQSTQTACAGSSREHFPRVNSVSVKEKHDMSEISRRMQAYRWLSLVRPARSLVASLGAPVRGGICHVLECPA